MAAAPTVPARFALNAVEFALAAGVDEATLRARAGMETVRLDDPDALITMAQLVALFEEGARATGDDAFGLHVGERTRFDVMGYALMASSSMRSAFEVLGPYLQAVHGGEETRLVNEGDIARFGFKVSDPSLGLSRHRSEAYLTVVLKIANSATGLDVPPLEVRFQHPRPADTSEHERIFRAHLHFDQPINELVFPAAHLDLPLAKADPGLSTVLERHLRETLEKLTMPHRLSDEVSRLVAEGFRTGDHSLEDVAKRMGMRPRTLQRRLSGEGTSHQDLLDRVRSELALRYLGETNISIKELAFLLGYSETTPFYRAFKRWIGSTPAEYRKTRGGS